LSFQLLAEDQGNGDEPMTAANYDGHKVDLYHDGHSNENVKN